jgi:hypothetical protein
MCRTRCRTCRCTCRPTSRGGPRREGGDKKKDKTDPPKKGVQLYDLSKDIGETKNLAAAEPQVVERLQAVYQRMTEDLKKGKLPIEK